MRVLVIGRQGMLAQEVYALLPKSGFDGVCVGRPEIDLSSRENILTIVSRVNPDIILNAGAYTGVDQAESEVDVAFTVNRDGTKYLAEECYKRNIPLIHISTDYVFDGTLDHPYRETDQPSPLGVYGTSKFEGEMFLRNIHAKHLIIRTSWVYSRYGNNFLKTMLRVASERKLLKVVNDQYGSPTWAKDLATALVRICEQIRNDGPCVKWGTYHYCGAGTTTWYQFAEAVIEESRQYMPLVVERIDPITTEEYPTAAMRPPNSVLDSSLIVQTFGVQLRDWKDGVHHCIQEHCECPTLLPTASL